jgi:hypothetical protein
MSILNLENKDLMKIIQNIKFPHDDATLLKQVTRKSKFIKKNTINLMA